MVVVLEPRRRLPLVTVGGTASSLPHLTAADRAGGGRCSGGLGRFAATPIVADHLSSLSLPPSSSSGVVVVVERSRRSLLARHHSCSCRHHLLLCWSPSRFCRSLLFTPCVSQTPEIILLRVKDNANCPFLLLTLSVSLSRATLR